jgi:hypothetical protein
LVRDLSIYSLNANVPSKFAPESEFYSYRELQLADRSTPFASNANDAGADSAGSETGIDSSSDTRRSKRIGLQFDGALAVADCHRAYFNNFAGIDNSLRMDTAGSSPLGGQANAGVTGHGIGSLSGS